MTYSIHHINLSELNSLPEETIEANGYYVVWYHNIPLGDFYIQSSEKVSNVNFRKKILVAIKENVHFYTNESGESWMNYILNNDLPAFNRWLSFFIKSDITIESKSLPVSVIICTRNRASYLEKCLQRLRYLEYTPQEIIVVDNAPTNNETKAIVNSQDGIKYIIEPRIGLDIARNTGVKNATKSIVAFIDDDAIAHPHWIYRIWETFENNAVAAMTGLVFPSKLETEAQFLFEKYWSFNRGFRNKFYDANYIESNKRTGAPVWEIGAGVNMAFRREVFEKVGYFNESLDAGAAGCNGDSEMWFRILKNGFAMEYNPKAVVFHEHREDMQSLKKQIFNYMKGNTAAALIQEQYHPTSVYSRYIRNTFKRKIKSFILATVKSRWISTKIISLELRGMVAGIIYYYKRK